MLEESGVITREIQLKYTIEAHKTGRELGINKYLVDVVKAKNVESTVGNYEFAYTDAKRTDQIDKTAIVALLVAPEDHSHDFSEVVARNSGLYVKLFRDRDSAIEYLKGRSTKTA